MENKKTYQKINNKIKKFSEDRDWSQFHDPKNLELSLVLEASEVLELYQWTKDNQLNSRRSEKISEELADVFYWVIMLSNYYNIDLLDALDKKLDKKVKKRSLHKLLKVFDVMSWNNPRLNI
jgi:NTP pyrophosphatase (non-canonical NTP hydrolase)